MLGVGCNNGLFFKLVCRNTYRRYLSDESSFPHCHHYSCLELKAPRSSVSTGHPTCPWLWVSGFEKQQAMYRCFSSNRQIKSSPNDHDSFLSSYRLILCVFSSPPRKNFTSSVAASLACHWSCKHCSQLSNQISAHCSCEASCWTPLTCWLQLTASSRCSMKVPPGKYPAAQQSSVLRISHERDEGTKKIVCSTK